MAAAAAKNGRIAVAALLLAALALSAQLAPAAACSCCPLLSGVADLDAALCLCTAIKAKALGVSLVLPVAISVLVNECGKHVPSSFQCPS
ncbi:Os04g0612500 [Oryza sativa Japonica Group]|uniref:Os04g0612500 protein n=2 Tax=Oryza sativa subsp. japonica TaxID=39947 RepID=B9FCG2_ORYSJ|nr:hypothetical protein OsJ_16129 [Oryza sativa Japonica Group]KAB8096895.1 hypothetical protein EE612_025505 [Oryza sativa]BAS90966.1 Os04g0612500 [Oryza sativa Japonica Group]